MTAPEYLRDWSHAAAGLIAHACYDPADDMSRITAVDVTVVEDRNFAELGLRMIRAQVRGQNRTFAVDYNTARGEKKEWWCRCGHAPECPHVRAVKEKLA